MARTNRNDGIYQRCSCKRISTLKCRSFLFGIPYSCSTAEWIIRARAFLPLKICSFQHMGKIFSVQFQRAPLIFLSKYLAHALKDIIFILLWSFRAVRIKDPKPVLKYKNSIICSFAIHCSNLKSSQRSHVMLICEFGIFVQFLISSHRVYGVHD